MTVRVLTLAALIALASLAQAEDRYSGTWSDNQDRSITKTLSRNNVSDCRAYRYQKSVNDPSDYLVSCTGDGKTWVAYHVNTDVGVVTGPHRID